MMTTVQVIKAQSYKISGFDGTTKVIHVSERGEILTISYLTDTLHIQDFNNFMEDVSILNKNFLKIIYRVRAGTGLDDQHTLLLCINGKTLCQALHVMSIFNEDFIDYSKKVDLSDMIAVKSRYQLYLDMNGTNAQNFTLNIKIHDERKSKLDPQENYTTDKQVLLKFDLQKKIFYNTNKTISRHFKIFDPKTQAEINQYVSGTFPAIKMGKTDYYFIRDEWYEKNKYGDLTKYTYK